MSHALANVQYKPTELTTERLGQVMVKSGFFKDLREEAQAIVKILYGAELGFGPMASVMGVYIVEGKPSLSAQLIASAVQRSGRFRYRVREWTATKCRIEFFEEGESIGESSFSLEEATAAGLAGKAVWKSYPKAMLWARAMSQGARAYTPEIFLGAIYTPEELGANVDEDGRVVEVTGQAVPYVPTRERDPEPTVDEELEALLAGWHDVCAEARLIRLRVPTLPDNAPPALIEKWTGQLLDRINERPKTAPEPAAA